MILAAHCFQNKGYQTKTSPHEIIAYQGKHDLDVDDEYGSTKCLLWDVVIHHDWDFNDRRFDADIAIAVLIDVIKFTDKIQQVCLPQPNYDEVIGDGFVPGWGKSKIQQTQSSTPNELQVTAVNASHCYTSFPKLESISSNRMFCGGFENQGRAPCMGDSGSGFYRKSKTTLTWEVLGIVSASYVDFDIGCDINKFSLYTNVARFDDWTQRFMKETEMVVWKNVDFNCKKYEG